MSFHRPLLLLLLLLPVLWVAFHWSRAGIPLWMPFDYTRGKRGDWLRRITSAFECTPALLLACAIVILAGPRRAAPPKDQRVLNNIILLVDVSLSMETPVAGGRTRFETAMEAARAFCSRREGDAFGLSIFGMDFLHWFPPTKDLSALKNTLQFIQPKQLPRSFAGTFIANALKNCVPRMNATKEGDRAIILLTDGESADFDGNAEREVAEQLSASKIRLFSIIIGADPENGMYTLTARTGGKVYRADDPNALREVFAEIDTLQKARFRQVTNDWVDWYEPAGIAGLFSLAAIGLNLLGLRFTPW